MKKLQLIFKAKSGKKNNLQLSYVNENLDQATTKTAMAKIVASNLFQKNDFPIYDYAVGAKYIDRQETVIFE